MFACFMVITNWSILAILTSVVSDNMISASRRHEEENEDAAKAHDRNERIKRLHTAFGIIDTDNSGTISEDEWNQMLADEPLHNEICSAIQMSAAELQEHFDCLAKDQHEEVGGRTQMVKALGYDQLMAGVESGSDPAPSGGVLNVLSSIHNLQLRIDAACFALATVVQQTSRLNMEVVGDSSSEKVVEKMLSFASNESFRDSTSERLRDSQSERVAKMLKSQMSHRHLEGLIQAQDCQPESQISD
jgi:hypothetical protein